MMEIAVLKEIAQWLGREEDLSKLVKLEEIQRSKSYFMTFWGHYSAGKSKLINCILDRDILPIQNRETTAVLTYIQYGVEEGCRVIYNDGSYLDKKIESVKEIFQNTEDCEELRKINHLEIFVNDELLKNGLVLVDTPGANTLIQQHQILAAEAIEQSGKIVYVLGSSPSKIDMEFIKQISDCGIDILFVRTKCDKINPDEEDILEALNKEKEEVESHLNKEVMFISVSNEKNSEWNENIKEVRQILNEASDSLSEELEVALNMRLQVYMKKYKEELIEICQEIKNTLEGNEQLLDEKIKKYNGEVERLSNVENEIEEKVENKINQSKKLVKNDIEEFIDKKVDSFRVFLETVENSPNYSKDVKKQYRNYLINAIGKIQEIINGYFETIVKEENDALTGIVDSTIELVQNRETPRYEEVKLENTRILEMYNSKLTQIKNELENTNLEKENINQKLQSMESSEIYDDDVYRERIEELKDELDSISTETVMREVEPDGIQPSTIGKRIGQVADLALLLLPGEMIVKGVQTVAKADKVAKGLKGMGKAGEVILKTGSKLSTSSKFVNNVDRTRDMAYMANNLISSARKEHVSWREKRQAKKLINNVAKQAGEGYDNLKEKKKFGNVLDALSVAYWTEKIGSQFDTPPKMEVDVEAEKERLRLREEITRKQQGLSEERIKRKKELGLINSRAKELEMQAQEKEKVKKEIELDIAKQEKEIQENAVKEAKRVFSENYIMYLESNLQSAAAMIAENYYKTAKHNIVIYVANHNLELISSIQERKGKLEELKQIRENGNEELRERLEIGKGYINNIEECIN